MKITSSKTGGLCIPTTPTLRIEKIFQLLTIMEKSCIILSERINLLIRLFVEKQLINFFTNTKNIVRHDWSHGSEITDIKNQKEFSLFYLKNGRISYRAL